MAKKLKIEWTGIDGSKIKIELPNDDPDRVYYLLKNIRRMFEGDVDGYVVGKYDNGISTIQDKVEDLIRNEFGMSPFSLSDIYKAYSLKYGQNISKSTLSTYLSRFVQNGLLERVGRRGRYIYKLRT